MKLSPAVASAAAHAIDLPWHTEGLFSAHYLTRRLPDPKSALWPTEAESDAAFDAAKQRLESRIEGLKKGNEEDCEKEWISPLLTLLGFGVNNRKALPDTPGLMLPDYLLYGSAGLAQAAFQVGTRTAYYADCLGLLEAKRWGVNLSREATGKAKARSPHQQIRDYLSESEGLSWGVLTNGAQWRLYCKRDRASSYFEIDLAQILTAPTTAETRAQFRLFFALFRRAAWERGPDGRSGLDAVRQGAQQFKEEVERRLRVQVFDGVEILARGFLENAGNGLSDDDLTDVYQNCLILLYRILFVLNAEARDLLPTRPADTASKKYYNSYGLERVRLRLAKPDEAAEYEDDGTFGLYERLHSLFLLINGRPGPAGKPDKNEELNIPRYNGGLFDPDRYPFLETKRVGDRAMAQVLRRLSYRTDGGETVAFDYANLGERHLGSIYEGLLEHRLARGSDGIVALTNDKGERKTSGAYYTPEAWVAYIVRHSLAPLLTRLDAQISGFHRLPPASTGFHRLPPASTGFHRLPRRRFCGGCASTQRLRPGDGERAFSGGGRRVSSRSRCGAPDDSAAPADEHGRDAADGRGGRAGVYAGGEAGVLEAALGGGVHLRRGLEPAGRRTGEAVAVAGNGGPGAAQLPGPPPALRQLAAGDAAGRAVSAAAAQAQQEAEGGAVVDGVQRRPGGRRRAGHCRHQRH